MLAPRTRRVTAVVAAVALLASAALVAVVSVRTSEPPPVDTEGSAGSGGPMTAVFLGDSITFGDADLTTGRPGDRSWFSGLVGGAEPALELAGLVAENGRTTSWMAERAADAVAGHPGLLVVLGGTNDIAVGLPLEQTLANLHGIADAAGRAGSLLAVATLPPLDVADDPAAVGRVNDAIRTFAADRGAVLLDIGPAVTDSDGRWLPGLSDDGIHPNAEGAAAMSRAAAAALRERA